VSPPAEYFFLSYSYIHNRSGFAGAFIDREVETRGVSILLFFVYFLRAQFCILQLDFIDKEKAKYQGKQLHWIIALTSCLSSAYLPFSRSTNSWPLWRLLQQQQRQQLLRIDQTGTQF
jgi:hypothetical protein